MTESKAKLIESMAGDYSNVLKEAKSMGCNDIRALYNIPLKNMELIINALEKQIPKKIIHFQYDDGRINYGCPICKRKIISKIDDKWCAGDFQNFCDSCGQKIDWSDEK